MPALNRLTGELLEAEKSETQLDRELLNLRKKLSAALVLRGQLQAYTSSSLLSLYIPPVFFSL